jgi:molybdopterin-guanine dinucleotide biosynthesis protein A
LREYRAFEIRASGNAISGGSGFSDEGDVARPDARNSRSTKAARKLLGFRMNSSGDISGVILAGGSSRRLPEADKLSLDIGGAKLIERAHRALRTFCPEIIVVGDGGSDAELPETRRIRDSRSGRQGPLAGLEAGLSASSNDTAFAAAGDMPFLSPELAVHLCELVEEKGLPAAVPVYGGTAHPLCAAYRRDVADEISAALDGGTRSMKEFLASLGQVEYVEYGLERFGDPGLFLMNVNSPEDLERAREFA